MRLVRVPVTFSDFVAVVLREERERRRISQRELAEQLGMHQPMLSRIEQNSVPLTVDQLVRVCDGLGLSVLQVTSRALKKWSRDGL